MARPRAINPCEKIHISLPGDLAIRLSLYLTSPALGKVPYGAYQKFFAERTREFFDRAEANLRAQLQEESTNDA